MSTPDKINYMLIFQQIGFAMDAYLLCFAISTSGSKEIVLGSMNTKDTGALAESRSIQYSSYSFT